MKTPFVFVFGGCFTFGFVWLTALIALKVTGVPRDFPPFTMLPLLSGVASAFIGAPVVYAVVRLVAARPERTFFFIAIGLLAFSFGLPLRLSFTKSHRFAGVTPAAQMSLAVIHTIIAASIVTLLTNPIRR